MSTTPVTISHSTGQLATRHCSGSTRDCFAGGESRSMHSTGSLPPGYMHQTQELGENHAKAQAGICRA
jgi:hypothetical protein